MTCSTLTFLLAPMFRWTWPAQINKCRKSASLGSRAFVRVKIIWFLKALFCTSGYSLFNDAMWTHGPMGHAMGPWLHMACIMYLLSLLS